MWPSSRKVSGSPKSLRFIAMSGRKVGGQPLMKAPEGRWELLQVHSGKLRPSAALIDFLKRIRWKPGSLEGWRRTETGHKATSLIHGFRKTTAILSVDCCFRTYGQDCFDAHLQMTKDLSAYKLIAPFPQVKNHHHHHHHTCQIETTWFISASQYIWCIYRNLIGGQN